MLSQDQDSNKSDTIIVNTRLVYTEHMPPLLNQEQGNRQHKRQADQILTTIVVEDRVKALQERVERAKEAKRQKQLLNEEQELIRELEELED